MLRPKIAPMGWNSWDCYGAAVTENEVRQNAEFMASNLLYLALFQKTLDFLIIKAFFF